MLRQFLLLWVLCALATALPQNKKSVETESEEPGKRDSNNATKSKTTLSTTNSSTTDSPLTTTTGVTTSTTVTTSITTKPESKVINIKHAAELANAMSNAGDKLVVIFVMTSWCGYSLQIEPTVEEVARSTENLIVLKVVHDEVDKSEDWKYGVNYVTNVPFFSYWKNGTKLAAFASASANGLKKRIAKYMIRRV